MVIVNDPMLPLLPPPSQRQNQMWTMAIYVRSQDKWYKYKQLKLITFSTELFYAIDFFCHLTSGPLTMGRMAQFAISQHWFKLYPHWIEQNFLTRNPGFFKRLYQQHIPVHADKYWIVFMCKQEAQKNQVKFNSILIPQYWNINNMTVQSSFQYFRVLFFCLRIICCCRGSNTHCDCLCSNKLFLNKKIRL